MLRRADHHRWMVWVAEMNLREQLIRDEGIRLKAYYDTMGKITVGVGRNLTDKGLSQDEALYLLDNDIREAQNGVLTVLPWTVGLDEPRMAVLINMAFNLGLRGLLSFRKTLEAIAKADYDDAAKHMLDSDWAEQVGKRATRLAEQMRSGRWV